MGVPMNTILMSGKPTKKPSLIQSWTAGALQNVDPSDIPDVDGMIGEIPPCQSWSAAGKLRVLTIREGSIVFDFIRILQEKNPNFPGGECSRYAVAPNERRWTASKTFKESGYQLSFSCSMLPTTWCRQDRKRCFLLVIVMTWVLTLNSSCRLIMKLRCGLPLAILDG